MLVQKQNKILEKTKLQREREREMYNRRFTSTLNDKKLPKLKNKFKC